MQHFTTWATAETFACGADAVGRRNSQADTDPTLTTCAACKATPAHRDAMVAPVVEAMKAEILAFIESGDIPADVPDFSRLHDYVDANMLAFEVYASEIPEDETDEQGEARMDRETPIFNAASDEVSAWLKAGRDATWKLIGENTLTGNRWDCETGLTKAAADEYRAGYARLESDYKVTYRVEAER